MNDKRLIDGQNRATQVDEFFIDAPNVGQMQRLRIGHDNRGLGAAWHLSRVEITNLLTGEAATFVCNRWLDSKEGLAVELGAGADGVAVVAPGATDHKYMVRVYTGTDRGAGTSANVSIELRGDAGVLGSTRLEKGRGDFDRGAVTDFLISGSGVGAVKSIKIGHDGAGDVLGNSAWQLQQVEVQDLTVNGPKYVFDCHEWLKEPEGRSRVLYAAGSDEARAAAAAKPSRYTVTTVTSDLWGAGTDGHVFVTLRGPGVGAAGSPPVSIRQELPSKTGRNLFERAQTDVFFIEGPAIGKLTGLTVELAPGCERLLSFLSLSLSSCSCRASD